MITVTSTSQFNTLIAKPVLTVVDFYADWCGPCKQIAPVYATLSGRYPSTQFLKVNVDTLDEVSSTAQVTGMPTFVFYRNGKEVHRIVGADIRGVEDYVEKNGNRGGSESTFKGQGHTLSGSTARNNVNGNSFGIDQVMLFGLVCLFVFLYSSK
jgi:thioredoxin 1